MIYALFLLFTKHLIIDFPLQTPYQWMNKGTYGHPGGLLHAGLHALGTYIVFIILNASIEGAFILAFIDGFLHYHIDWVKMKLNKFYGWTPKNPQFWTLLGLDQYLHLLTYLLLVIL